MALPPASGAPKQSDPTQAATVATRIWDVVKRLATITEHLRSLEKEDARIQAQLVEISRIVLDLTKEVREMIGQMKGIEKRLDDRDRLVEATIRVRIMEEIEKLRTEFRRPNS